MNRSAPLKRQGALKRGGAIQRTKAMRKASRRQRRALEEYRAAREVVRRRCRGRCERCGGRFTAGDPFECHHMLPRSRARYAHDPSTMAGLHRSCHAAITERRAPDWRRWILPAPGDRRGA